MGCASSVQASPSFSKGDPVLDSPSRGTGSTPVFDKDTTASGKYSTRRSLTVWDLKAEKERRMNASLRHTPSPLSEHSFRRSVSASDRMFVVPVSESRFLTRQSGGSFVSPRPRQTTIPPWHVNHRPLSKSNCSQYAGSVVGNSPSSRSVHAHRSGLYGAPPSPSSVSSSYNYQPPSPSQSRVSTTNRRQHATDNLRASKSSSNFSDMSPRAHSRYGERSSSQLYPSRRVR